MWPKIAKGLKVTCLLCYCSKGDRIPDAFLLEEAASKAYGKCGKWQIPYSWISMYGLWSSSIYVYVIRQL
ncbi:hypothetical protein AALP_AA3G215800 [Arabis alpina]|uniref:Uncharacterized protein n=1 Tax=Arabis alpina TaxID=50452 RepID=A0A087HAS0_ARAAL|nr:hypothetical protein AALP_AA3G215800 [Arabis alpina]